MPTEYAKFKHLEKEYSCLLEIASHGEDRVNIGSKPFKNLEEHIKFLEKEIMELKKELQDDGIDVESYLKKL